MGLSNRHDGSYIDRAIEVTLEPGSIEVRARLRTQKDVDRLIAILQTNADILAEQMKAA